MKSLTAKMLMKLQIGNVLEVPGPLLGMTSEPLAFQLLSRDKPQPTSGVRHVFEVSYFGILVGRMTAIANTNKDTVKWPDQR